jgi:predicted P-loop ATPase
VAAPFAHLVLAMALWTDHVRILMDRAIDPAYAERLGVESVDLREEKRLVERLGKAPACPGIPLYATTGLRLPYQPCVDGVVRLRVRSDVLEYTLPGPVEGQADVGARTVTVHRYLAQKGVPVVVFWTPEALAIAADVSQPLYMTEAPLKAMSLACNGFPAGGMGGVLAGAHDVDVKSEIGEIVGNREFLRINWRGRRGYIVYDASIADPKRPLVALGAAYLGLALRAAGAEPWLVRIPAHHPTEDDIMAGAWYRPEDQGPDDFIHRRGVDAFRSLVDAAEPLEPLARLNRRTFRSQRERAAVAVSWLSDLPTAAYLYAAGDAVLAEFLVDTKLPAKLARGAITAYGQSLKPKTQLGTWVKDVKRTDKGAPQGSVYNGLVVLRGDERVRGVLAFDELAGAAVLKSLPPWVPSEWTEPREVIDPDVVRLAAWLDQSHELKLKTGTLHELVDAAARERSFHPVRDELESFHWDGEERISAWLIDICGAEDTPYVRRVSRQSLIRHVARAYKPGCLVKQAVVLEGDQNFRKSMVIRELVGARWWTDQLPSNLGDKDAQQNLVGVWGIEISELASKKRTDLEMIKAYLARYDDRYRPSYGRRVVRRPRSCVFWATTNEYTYLSDTTGNVRWEPVRVGRANIDKLKALREQLWAEAVVAYKADERWWTDDPQEVADHAAEVELRRHEDPWVPKVAEFVADKTEITIYEILKEGLDIAAKAMTRVDEMRVAGLLQLLGWRKDGRRKVVEDNRGHVYVRPAGTDAQNPTPARPLRLAEEQAWRALVVNGWVESVLPTGQRVLTQPSDEDEHAADVARLLQAV